MTKYGVHQMVMSRGEVTPLVRGRVDLPEYLTGLAECKNWLPQRYGGLTRVPGTTDMNACADPTTRSRVIPFIFNQNQSYAMEFSNLVIRFHTTSGYISGSGIASNYTTADLWNIQLTSIGDVVYIVCDGFPIRTITRTSDAVWVLTDFAFKGGPWLPPVQGGKLSFDTSVGSVVPDMTSNTTPAGTAVTDSAGSANAYKVFDRTGTDLNITGSNGWVKAHLGSARAAAGYMLTAPRAASAAANMPTSWTLLGSDDDITWTVLDAHRGAADWAPNERRWFPLSNTATYLYYKYVFHNVQSATAGGTISSIDITLAEEPLLAVSGITLTSVGDVNGGSGFVVGSDKSRLIRVLSYFGMWSILRIYNPSSSSYGSAQLSDGSPGWGADNTGIFQMGAWGRTPGYPQVVTKHKGRLAFFRTDTQPTTGWFSVSQDFDNFGTSDPLLDDDAITITMNDGDLDEVLWARSNGSDILLGTAGGIRVVNKVDDALALSPSNVEEEGRTAFRVGTTEPVWLDRTLVFAGKQRKRLYETTFSRDARGYVSTELTGLAEHLFRGKIKELHYQETPTNTLWAVMDDGGLRACTYDQQGKVFGVAQIIYPGTGVTVESMAVLPDTEYDTPMIVVGRTVNGSTTYRIEKIADPYFSGGGSSLSYPHYMAGAVLYSGASTSTITGLSHLEGETVAVYDTTGTDLGDATVTSGQITVPGGGSVTEALVGLRMTSTFTTLKPPGATQNGEYLAEPQRVVGMTVDMYETYGITAGGPTQQQALTSETDHALAPAVKVLYTGEVEVHNEEGWDFDVEMTVATDRAYPATVRAIQVTMERGV